MIKNNELAGWFLKWLSSHKSTEDDSSCHLELTNKPFDPSLYYNEGRVDTRDQYSGKRVAHLFLRQFQDIGRLSHSQPSHVSAPCPKQMLHWNVWEEGRWIFFEDVCVCGEAESWWVVRSRLYRTEGEAGGDPVSARILPRHWKQRVYTAAL